MVKDIVETHAEDRVDLIISKRGLFRGPKIPQTDGYRVLAFATHREAKAARRILIEDRTMINTIEAPLAVDFIPGPAR